MQRAGTVAYRPDATAGHGCGGALTISRSAAGVHATDLITKRSDQ